MTKAAIRMLAILWRLEEQQMNLLEEYLAAIEFGVTELHAKASLDAYNAGYEDAYNQGYGDGVADGRVQYADYDTDQGDEEPFLSDEYYDPFTRDVDYSKFLAELPVNPVFEAGMKVRVLTGVNIIDSQLVEGREGFVIEVAGEEHTHHRALGQTVLVGFPGPAIERPGTAPTYTQTWWLSPEALEVVA